MDHLLRPDSPEDALALYQVVRDALGRRLCGEANQPALDALSLAAVRHLMGHAHNRVTIVGEPGSGKSSLANSLALAVGAPAAYIAVPEMAETSWGGAPDLPDRLRAAVESLAAERRLTREGALGLAEDQMMVILDDLQAVRMQRYQDYSASDRGQREGRQRSLLGLLQGMPLVAGDDQHAWQIRTERMLVIACMESEDLPDSGAICSLDLQRWGMMPALAERLAAGTILRLHAVAGDELADMIAEQVQRVMGVGFRAFGYELQISPEAARYAVRANRGGGTRAASGLLRSAAERALIAMVSARVAPSAGAVRVLGPDDIDAPLRSR